MGDRTITIDPPFYGVLMFLNTFKSCFKWSTEHTEHLMPIFIGKTIEPMGLGVCQCPRHPGRNYLFAAAAAWELQLGQRYLYYILMDADAEVAKRNWILAVSAVPCEK